VKILLLMIVLFLIAGFVLVWFKKRTADSATGKPWPFYVKKPLTQPEQILYHRLVAAVPEHIVLAQVQLSRVLGVKKGFNFAEWNNRINRMSLDFLICSKDSAVELDDHSHDKAARVTADARKDKALLAAGVKLVRWHVASLPDEAAIRAALLAKPLTVKPLPATEISSLP
jgi:hypothetical protein